MGVFEKRGSPSFVEVRRWLFISGSESHRLQTMEFVNSHEAFKSLHVDFADYHLEKFERPLRFISWTSDEEGDLYFSASRLSQPLRDLARLLSVRITRVHQVARLQRARVPGVQHRTPNGVLLVAGAEILPSRRLDSLNLWRKQDHLCCIGKY